MLRCGDWLASGLLQFRKDTDELGTDRRTEAVPNRCVEHCAIVAEGIDPGLEGENLFRFVASPNQDSYARRNYLPDKFPKQSALADTGLAAQQDHAPGGIEHFRQRVIQATELEFAADHRRFVSPGVCLSTQGRGRCLLTVGTGTGTTQDIAVDLPRFFLRFDAQFPLEPVDALLILFHCRRSLPLTLQQSHQRPLHPFLRWIDGEQTPRRRDCSLRCFGCLPINQTGQCLDSKRIQPVAFEDAPFIEFRLVQIEACQKFAFE